MMRSLFGFLIQFFAYFILSFNTPILNTHLDRLGYDPKFIGISISCVAFFYALSVPCVQVLLKYIEKRGCMMVGIIFMTVATLMTGVESENNQHITTAFVLTG